MGSSRERGCCKQNTTIEMDETVKKQAQQSYLEKRSSYFLLSPIKVKGVENRFPIFDSPDVSTKSQSEHRYQLN